MPNGEAVKFPAATCTHALKCIRHQCASLQPRKPRGLCTQVSARPSQSGVWASPSRQVSPDFLQEKRNPALRLPSRPLPRLSKCHHFVQLIFVPHLSPKRFGVQRKRFKARTNCSHHALTLCSAHDCKINARESSFSKQFGNVLAEVKMPLSC